MSASLIPYAGIQNDEALFATPLFVSVGRQFEARIFHHHVPLMLNSYLGTLKTLIYWPIFQALGTNVWTLRLPMVLVGAITIFLFYDLLLRSGARRPALAAALGVFLLATDPAFILTNTFDWGPVALEHLLLVSSCLLLLRFAEKHTRVRCLFAGFFLFGLALWNKAIFLWALSGLTVGSLAVFRGELSHCVTKRNVRIALTAMFLGALPLVIFNLHRRNATLSENVHFDSGPYGYKWIQVKNAANGNALQAYIVSVEDDGPAKPAVSLRGRAAVWINEHLGEHHESGFYYVFGALIVAVPLWWRYRAARFSLVFLAVAWCLMAATKGAGTGTHHVILLWPFPALFAAMVLSAIPWRPVAILAGGALLAMNLLVVNQYLVQFERNGAAGNFTDALFPLSKDLDRYPDAHIYSTDWGYDNGLNLLDQDRFRVRSAMGPLDSDSPSEIERAQLHALLADRAAIFAGHVPAREVFQGYQERLERFAAAAGYRKEMLETVPDSNGRPVFEIFRFQKAGGV